MKKLISLLLLPLLALPIAISTPRVAAQEAVKSIQSSRPHGSAALTNLDIIRMLKADFSAETIAALIKSSPCDFATTPAALHHLKEEDVPDSVILAMVMAPATGLANRAAAQAQQKNVTVKIPSGLAVEVEAPYTISSQDVREGDAISFRVVNPVKVDGILVIEAGATATAKVVKASRGGHFGRAGRLAWAMESVTAIDGSRIPLQSAGRLVGDSKGAKVATQMIITGAALWLIAPVALLHGFKRGENAILHAGKRLEVLVHGGVSVNGVSNSNE